MSIIICHNNQRIDAQEMKALIKFYRMEHLQIGISTENIPRPGTLCFVDQSITTIPKDLYKDIRVTTLNKDIRVTTLNEAFAEMARSIMTIMEGIELRESMLEGRLKLFLKNQNGEIFTLDDALMYLDCSQDSKDDINATEAVISALDKLGCHKELTTIYTPPSQPSQSVDKSHIRSTENINVRIITREELVS